MQDTTKSLNDAGLRALLKADRNWILAMTLAAFALRLLFILRFPLLTPDSLVYGDLAKNWLLHHVYGLSELGSIVPTYIRLPGYPAFLAVLWSVFGIEHYGAARFAQMFLDVATCFAVADLSRRAVGGTSSGRVARWAFALTALCPFLANYTAVPLTEAPTIFFTALALDFAVAALRRQHEAGRDAPRLWAACGLAIAACIYLRPDGGILLIAIGAYLLYHLARRPDKAHTFWAGVVLCACALTPLAPWTLRNWLAFHRFQPLAPVAANAPGEFVARGCDRWMRTWVVDYASIEDVGFRLDSDPISLDVLPSRAFDNPEERSRTAELLEQYNEDLHITPELDAQFDQLARQRIRRHPLRYYIELPLLRALDLWLRPRSELLPIDVHWWKFSEDPHDFAWALLLGFINLGYLTLAILGLRRRRCIAYTGMLVGFLMLRTALIVILTFPEPRYVLECYTVVMMLGSVAIACREGGLTVDRPVVLSGAR